MTWFKKQWWFLLLLFFVYGWYFISHTVHPQQQQTQVLGANTQVSLVTEPTEGRTQLLVTLANAKKEILVEVYLLSDKEVIAALSDAEKRGVDVRVMLEQHPVGGGSLNNSSSKALQTSGIKFAWTNSAFTLTHEKAIVIDDAEALILSQNLTASSFTKNREYDIFDTNPQDVQEVRNMFIADWERSSFIPPATHLLVSPVNARSALTTLITSGKNEIDIEVEDIADEQMVSLLCEKIKTNSVKILLPTLSQLAGNKKDLDELATCGVAVETISSPYMHAKLILVDDAQAYVGSVNLSTQSMDENRELGVILTEQNILQSLATTFQTDWGKGKPYGGSN